MRWPRSNDISVAESTPRAQVFASVVSDRRGQEPVDVVDQGWLGNAQVRPRVHCSVNQEVPTKYTETQNDGGVSETQRPTQTAPGSQS